MHAEAEQPGWTARARPLAGAPPMLARALVSAPVLRRARAPPGRGAVADASRAYKPSFVVLPLRNSSERTVACAKLTSFKAESANPNQRQLSR